MAAVGNAGQTLPLPSKDMTNEDLHEFSNIFSSEFNQSDIHDRVLCFQMIENEEFDNKADSEDDESETGSWSPKERGYFTTPMPHYLTRSKHTKQSKPTTAMASSSKSSAPLTSLWNPSSSSSRRLTRSRSSRSPTPQATKFTQSKHSYTTTMADSTIKYDGNKDSAVDQIMENSNTRETLEQKEDGEEPRNEYQNKDTKSTGKDGESKSIVSKLFVHSQWLAVQSPYFKALFYSGMKETYSKEVVMKIYEDDLQSHITLIEAMYKLDVLNDKDYRLLVQVLVLANKYDVRLVIKKCKYVLLSTPPSLEMCDYCLREMEHLSDMADIYDMLEKFLVKEFTPIDETWTMKKFTGLSKAALRLLLGSDSLGSRSENTVFVALMKWVRLNVFWVKHDTCDLLDLVRFEFMSVDFLYDVVQDHFVARRMPGYDKFLLKGLSYHGFSRNRREQLEPKPKKRRLVEDAGPTFSWVIDDKLVQELTKFPGVPVSSDIFWYHGYAMRLRLDYAQDLSKCSFYLEIIGLKGEACVQASFKAKSILFSVEMEKTLYTAGGSNWGYGDIACNKAKIEQSYAIDVRVKID